MAELLPRRRVIAIDFDGVIHRQLTPWRGSGRIEDKPVNGVKEAIAELNRDYTVVVFSCRARTETGRAAIIKWLDDQGIKVNGVVNNKPHADIYIDDKAICFNGVWPDTIQKIKSFRNYRSEIKAKLSRIARRRTRAALCGPCGDIGAKMYSGYSRKTVR